MNGLAILGAILGAGGGISSGYGAANKEAIARQEEERRAAADALRNSLLNEQLELEKQKMAGQSMPAQQFYSLIGQDAPAGGPETIPRDLMGDLLKMAATEQARKQEQANALKTALFLKGAGGQPSQLMGALAEGEDPEAAAMIPRSPNVPPMDRGGIAAGLTALGHKDAGIKSLVETILGPYKDPAGAAANFTPPPNARPKYTVDEKGGVSTAYENEPWQYEVARKALADIGWQPGAKGYDRAFFDAVSALTPVTEGGGAATRSQGIPSPPGGPPQPSQTPTVITGPPKPVSGETAQRVAGAEEARRAATTLGDLSKRATTAGYLGPLDQYRETVQRMTPGALLGEVPNDVVDMKQALNTLNNYFINLISGAAVSAQEGERLRAQLPQMSARPEVFQRQVQTTIDQITRLEQRVSQLALHGNPRAQAVVQQYGITAPAPNPDAEGYTGIIVQHDMPKFSPGPGKVWIKAPDGVWGKWDAKKPVPEGYMR